MPGGGSDSADAFALAEISDGAEGKVEERFEMFAGGGRRRPGAKESTQEHRMGARSDFEAVVALVHHGCLGEGLQEGVFFAEKVSRGIDACREVRE